MNAIVLVALRRPLTFIALAILILLFGGRAAVRTPTGFFRRSRSLSLLPSGAAADITLSFRKLHRYQRKIVTEATSFNRRNAIIA